MGVVSHSRGKRDLNMNQSKHQFKILIGLCLVGVGIFACTRQSSSPAEAQAPGSTQREVNLAIWSNYLSMDQVHEFEKKHGIQVRISNYSSNEELLAKLQAGGAGYDVIVPSDYMIFIMSQMGHLKELDLSKISNLAHVDPKLRGRKFDLKNRYSVPYDWGTTGFAVNQQLHPGKITGWKSAWNTPSLAGQITLLDDAREVFSMAFKVLGMSVNTRDEASMKLAKEYLLSIKPKIKGFTSEPMVMLVNQETTLAHAYMSDALQAGKKSGGKITYVLPEEGGVMWIDNLAIPAQATHVQEAYEFIDFMLDAKTNRATVETLWVAPANQEVFGLLAPEYRTNASLFPSSKALARFEMLEDLGDSMKTMDRLWTEFKASR